MTLFAAETASVDSERAIVYILGAMPDSRKQASDSPSRSVSVIIPARDEASFIGSVITGVRQSLSAYNHEIITVDDGSKDKTAEIARASQAIVVSHQNSQGKGAAMKTGAKRAKGDIIVFLDSDGAHDPKEIPTVIAPIIQNQADLVIGSRALSESKVSRPPLHRRLSNNLASFIISIIISLFLPLTSLLNRLIHPRKSLVTKPRKAKAPQPKTRGYRLITGRLKWITDCTSGFRALTRDAWQRLNLASNEFQIETEMIYEAAKHKLTMAEVPISCNWDSKSSRLSIIEDGLRTSKLLLKKLWSNLRQEKT